MEIRRKVSDCNGILKILLPQQAFATSLKFSWNQRESPFFDFFWEMPWMQWTYSMKLVCPLFAYSLDGQFSELLPTSGEFREVRTCTEQPKFVKALVVVSTISKRKNSWSTNALASSYPPLSPLSQSYKELSHFLSTQREEVLISQGKSKSSLGGRTCLPGSR